MGARERLPVDVVRRIAVVVRAQSLEIVLAGRGRSAGTGIVGGPGRDDNVLCRTRINDRFGAHKGD